MRHKLLIFLFLCLLCCEFSEEDLQGPPDKPKNDKNKDQDESAQEEFASSAEDEDGAAALKIVPAPDLTKERDRRKGEVTVHVEIRDRDAVDLLMLDHAKVIQKMVQEIGIKNVMIEEADMDIPADLDELPPPPEVKSKELTTKKWKPKPYMILPQQS
ncbi:hypothetical protein MTP99_001784 [Tenebrio molitor]|nr:hypothetical protein MTP99_001784 [Tenebrio molitor]